MHRLESLLLATLGGLLGLLNLLDDTDSDGLTHVTDGEATERSVGLESLDELGVVLSLLGGTTVKLLSELSELAGNVSSVAVKHWGVSSGDLAWVLHDNDLGVEADGLLGWVVLGVGGDVATTDLLHGDVLDVEANVVTGHGLSHGLVVHLDGLDLSGHTVGGEGCDHTGLDHASLDTTDGNSSDATNLVDILEGKTGGLGLVERIEKVGALVPAHVGGVLDHVVSVEAGDGDEGDLLWVVASLLQEVGHLLLDLLVAGLAVGRGGVVHLVHGDTHLLHAKGVGEESVLTGLAILGDTGLELTGGRGHDEHGKISLRGAGDHVLDEVTVPGGIDDGEVVLGGLELPESDVNGDARSRSALSLSSTQAYLKEPLPISAA